MVSNGEYVLKFSNFHPRPGRGLCPLPSAFCLLPSAFCLLPSALCLLLSAFCFLPSAFCFLPTALCLLPSAFCLPSPDQIANSVSIASCAFRSSNRARPTLPPRLSANNRKYSEVIGRSRKLIESVANTISLISPSSESDAVRMLRRTSVVNSVATVSISREVFES
jgi:hypothetical protein